MNKLSFSSRLLPFISLFFLAIASIFSWIKQYLLETVAEVLSYSQDNTSLILSVIIVLFMWIASYYACKYVINKTNFPVLFHLIYNFFGFFVLEVMISRKIALAALLISNVFLFLFLLLSNKLEAEAEEEDSL
jgi:hypothetical protein